MGESTILDRKRVTQMFTLLGTTIRAERRRVAAKHRVFETFPDHVDCVDFPDIGLERPFDGGRRERHGATLAPGGHAGSRRATPTEVIQRANEETILAVSFHDEEYNPTATGLNRRFGAARETRQ